MTRHFTFVTRLYSGLFETVRTGQWRPTGIPTITELADRVCRKYPTTWIVVCKNETESAIVGHRCTERRINGIRFRIFPYRRWATRGRINLLAADLKAAVAVIRQVRRRGGGVVYCDRANIVPAGLIKTLSPATVIIRILGVYPDQKAMATRLRTRLSKPLTFAGYKVNYDLAVGTQDGSGIEFYMGRLLNRRTPAAILLNGVDFKPGATRRPRTDGPVRLLFVGKLIDDKGVIELVRAVSALNTLSRRFVLDIVGKGPLEPMLRRLVTEEGLEDTVFLHGSVGRERVEAFYASADVYISLNKLGNLSNTVLESMGAGRCTITLNHDRERHTDVYTQRAVPDDVVIRVDRRRITDDLAEKLRMLIEDPRQIDGYAARMKQFAGGFLWSWRDRISHELRLIEGAAGWR